MLLVYAFALCCQATWILAAENSRPTIHFPINAKAASGIAARRSAARLAASIGSVRGDLWRDYAATYIYLFWNDQNKRIETFGRDRERARALAYRALQYAPHDARTWLMLANIDMSFGGRNSIVLSELRMSYYTGSNEPQLIPLRLHLAVESTVINDAQLQQFVRHDLRIVLGHEPELKPTILAAYRTGSLAGRKFLQEALQELDPNMAVAVRSGNATQPNR